jgi:hypothetical protein
MLKPNPPGPRSTGATSTTASCRRTACSARSTRWWISPSSRSWSKTDIPRLRQAGAGDTAWNVENRPTAIGSSTFVYDGDGQRVKKVEGGQAIIYVNRYY